MPPASPPALAHLYLGGAITDSERSVCVEAAGGPSPFDFEELHLQLEGCASAFEIDWDATTLGTGAVHLLGSALLSVRQATAPDGYATFTLGCTGDAAPAAALALRNAAGCLVAGASYVRQDRVTFAHVARYPSLPPPAAPPLPPPTLPPLPPPPSSEPQMPPAEPPLAPPAPAPPNLLNCTVDHLTYRGPNPLNYSLATPDGNLDDEVSAAFDFMELGGSTDLACFIAGRRPEPSYSQSLLAPHRSWACADVATYQTLSQAHAGGALFGQACSGGPVPDAVYGDLIVDAHDVRVFLALRFSVYPYNRSDLTDPTVTLEPPFAEEACDANVASPGTLHRFTCRFESFVSTTDASSSAPDGRRQLSGHSEAIGGSSPADSSRPELSGQQPAASAAELSAERERHVHARHHCRTPRGSWYELAFAADAPPGSVSMRLSGFGWSAPLVHKRSHAAGLECEGEPEPHESGALIVTSPHAAGTNHVWTRHNDLQFVQIGAGALSEGAQEGALSEVRFFLWSNATQLCILAHSSIANLLGGYLFPQTLCTAPPSPPLPPASPPPALPPSLLPRPTPSSPSPSSTTPSLAACAASAEATCGGATELCFLDARCAGEVDSSSGGSRLGCDAGGHAGCRFCGFGLYADIPCPCVIDPSSADAAEALEEDDYLADATTLCPFLFASAGADGAAGGTGGGGTGAPLLFHVVTQLVLDTSTEAFVSAGLGAAIRRELGAVLGVPAQSVLVRALSSSLTVECIVLADSRAHVLSLAQLLTPLQANASEATRLLDLSVQVLRVEPLTITSTGDHSPFLVAADATPLPATPLSGSAGLPPGVALLFTAGFMLLLGGCAAVVRGVAAWRRQQKAVLRSKLDERAQVDPSDAWRGRPVWELFDGAPIMLPQPTPEKKKKYETQRLGAGVDVRVRI